jgi:Domain of unknown function (DUF4118)
MMDQTRKRETGINRYIAGAVTPLIVAGVRHPFLSAVTISAWYGGLAPGLVALLISFLMADYLLITPYSLDPLLEQMLRKGKKDPRMLED